jgi:hypothetical protein
MSEHSNARTFKRPALSKAEGSIVPRPSSVVGALLVAGLLLVACILPFTVRNYVVYGEFLLLNSNAGYAMYSAQHPMHGTSFQEYEAAPLPDDLRGRGLNEAQWDRELTRRGIGFVFDQPGRYLLLSLSRVRDYFEFWPTADSSLLYNVGRLASFTLFLPFMIYGIVLAILRVAAVSRPSPVLSEVEGSFVSRPSPALSELEGSAAHRLSRVHPERRRGTSSRDLPPSVHRHSSIRALRPFVPFVIHFSTTPVALLLLFMAFYSLLHILTWAMTRYRLPVDAVAIIFAALAIADLGRRIMNWFRSTSPHQPTP